MRAATKKKVSRLSGGTLCFLSTDLEAWLYAFDLDMASLASPSLSYNKQGGMLSLHNHRVDDM
jgi:hypothetical protein